MFVGIAAVPPQNRLERNGIQARLRGRTVSACLIFRQPRLRDRVLIPSAEADACSLTGETYAHDNHGLAHRRIRRRVRDR